MRVARGLRLATTLLVAASGAAIAQDSIPDGDWRTINRDVAATRFSPLAEINRSNVAQLTEAWNYPFRSFNTAVPIVVDGTMYFPAGSRIVALDADTGQEKWVYTFPRRPPARAAAGAAGTERLDPRRQLLAGRRGAPRRASWSWSATAMLALDAANGQPSAGFGEGGMIDVGIAYGGTPTIADDVAVIGAATLENQPGDPGNTRAFDVRTGRKLWEFSSVAQPGTARQRDLGQRLEGPLGHQHVGLRRPGRPRAGHRHHPARLAGAQLLGRRAAGREPLRQLARRARLQDRRVQVALPDGAPRHLGHRPGDRRAR